MRKEFVMNTKTIVRDIRVDTPVERVFDFLVDPNNLPEIWPNIIEVKNVKKSKDNQGFNFNWSYKMSGLPFEGKCETIEHTQHERLVFKSNKGLDSTITWRFQPSGRETHVTLRFEYQIPSSLLKRINEEVVIRENEHVSMRATTAGITRLAAMRVTPSTRMVAITVAASTSDRRASSRAVRTLDTSATSGSNGVNRRARYRRKTTTAAAMATAAMTSTSPRVTPSTSPNRAASSGWATRKSTAADEKKNTSYGVIAAPNRANINPERYAEIALDPRSSQAYGLSGRDRRILCRSAAGARAMGGRARATGPPGVRAAARLSDARGREPALKVLFSLQHAEGFLPVPYREGTVLTLEERPKLSRLGLAGKRTGISSGLAAS